MDVRQILAAFIQFEMRSFNAQLVTGTLGPTNGAPMFRVFSRYPVRYTLSFNHTAAMHLTELNGERSCVTGFLYRRRLSNKLQNAVGVP